MVQKEVPKAAPAPLPHKNAPAPIKEPPVVQPLVAGTDAGLQALLDPDGKGTGTRIIKRDSGGSATVAQYYVRGGGIYRGRDRWVTLILSDDDATHYAAVIAVLSNP